MQMLHRLRIFYWTAKEYRLFISLLQTRDIFVSGRKCTSFFLRSLSLSALIALLLQSGKREKFISCWTCRCKRIRSEDKKNVSQAFLLFYSLRSAGEVQPLVWWFERSNTFRLHEIGLPTSPFFFCDRFPREFFLSSSPSTRIVSEPFPHLVYRAVKSKLSIGLGPWWS